MIPEISQILDFLQIDYNNNSAYYSLKCPIHGSSKGGSVSIYKNTGIWQCWTNGCQEEYGRGFFNFLEGYFESIGQPKTISDIATLCVQIINYDISNLHNIEDYDQKIESVQVVNALLKERKLLQGKVLRKSIREKLYIPAQYYLDRGYNAEVLDKYDVGLCTTQGKEMFGRVVVPVYDDDYKYMVGCLGRTRYPKCEKCKMCHSSKRDCPSNSIEELWASKWNNSKNFKMENYLYNYWFSKPWIKQNKTVVIVEGQGDVWRLEEAGVNCSVGVFGSKLTDGQRMILEASGAQNIIIAPDNDEAGEKFRTQIREKCNRLFNIFDISLVKKDFGEMSIDETKKLVLPVLERCI